MKNTTTSIPPVVCYISCAVTRVFNSNIYSWLKNYNSRNWMITPRLKAYSEIWYKEVYLNSSNWFWYSYQRRASSCRSNRYNGMWMNFLNTCIATKALVRLLFFIVVILIETHTRDYLKIEALPLELVNEKKKQPICFSYPSPLPHAPDYPIWMALIYTD